MIAIDTVQFLGNPHAVLIQLPWTTAWVFGALTFLGLSLVVWALTESAKELRDILCSWLKKP